jgi:hypothetical protein
MIHVRDVQTTPSSKCGDLIRSESGKSRFWVESEGKVPPHQGDYSVSTCRLELWDQSIWGVCHWARHAIIRAARIHGVGQEDR